DLVARIGVHDIPVTLGSGQFRAELRDRVVVLLVVGGLLVVRAGIISTHGHSVPSRLRGLRGRGVSSVPDALGACGIRTRESLLVGTTGQLLTGPRAVLGGHFTSSQSIRYPASSADTAPHSIGVTT